MSVYTIVSGLKQFQAELNIPHLLLKKSTNIYGRLVVYKEKQMDVMDNIHCITHAPLKKICVLESLSLINW